MIRPVSVALITLALIGCGNNGDNEAGSAADAQPRQTDASLNFRGQTYQLAVTGDCGPTADGTYKTWAFTLDADGTPIPDAPHLLALSEDNWAVIDFYPGNGEQIVRVYREGRDQLEFVDGVLEFDGQLGAGLTETASVKIVCP